MRSWTSTTCQSSKPPSCCLKHSCHQTKKARRMVKALTHQIDQARDSQDRTRVSNRRRKQRLWEVRARKVLTLQCPLLTRVDQRESSQSLRWFKRSKSQSQDLNQTEGRSRHLMWSRSANWWSQPLQHSKKKVRSIMTLSYWILTLAWSKNCYS